MSNVLFAGNTGEMYRVFKANHKQGECLLFDDP